MFKLKLENCFFIYVKYKLLFFFVIRGEFLKDYNKCFVRLLIKWYDFLFDSEVEYRGVVLGMVQLEDKFFMYFRVYIIEVESDFDVNGELKDVQYDD